MLGKIKGLVMEAIAEDETERFKSNLSKEEIEMLEGNGPSPEDEEEAVATGTAKPKLDIDLDD